MKKMNRRAKVSGEIPSSAMGDIAFLLLIFFLVTTAFSTEKGLQLQLPELAEDEQEQISTVKVKSEDMLKIQVNADGSIEAGFGRDRNPVELPNLSGMVGNELDKNPDKLIIQVRLDDNALYDHMVQVLDELKKARAPRIHIVNSKRQ